MVLEAPVQAQPAPQLCVCPEDTDGNGRQCALESNYSITSQETETD
jgi:hypothetical protein